MTLAHDLMLARLPNQSLSRRCNLGYILHTSAHQFMYSWFTMATPKPSKRLAPEETSEDEVKCNVCKKYLREPKLLSCLHCFCKECLMSKFAEWSQESTIRCPTCNKETAVPNNDLLLLPTLNFLENIHVTAYKAKLRAITCDMCVTSPANAKRYCRHCGYVCEQCEQVHTRCKGYEDHEIVDIETLQGDIRRYAKVTTMPQKCKKHAHKLKYYCFTCQYLICRDCFTIGDHREHKYENISESKTTRFETLETSLKVLEESCQVRITEGIDSVEQVKSDINEQVRLASKEIEDAVSEAHQVLDERKGELLEQVQIRAKQKHDVLDEQLTHLRNTNAEIDRVYRTVDSCLHSENLPDITSAHRFMAEKMQGVIHECENIEVIPVAVANIKTKLGLSEAIRSSTKIVESSADPTKCSVITGEAIVGKEATVSVKTAYENGQPCIEPQEVVVKIHPEGKTDNTITATVNSCGKRGEYPCMFTPTIRGWHRLHVMVNKQTILNNPFQMYIDMPPSQFKEIHRSIGLDLPYQAAFTANNQMIVSQSAKVTLIDGDNHTEFCKENSHNGYHSTGIAAAKDGSVYVAYDKPCIVKYNLQGQKVCETIDITVDDRQLQRPGRIELNKDESSLYVCDRGNERVVIFDTNLNPIRVFAEGGQLVDIAFGDDNHVFLSDKNKNTILMYTSNGRPKYKFGESILKAPRGLLIHSSHLYVSDRNNARIAVFESSGEHKLVATFGTVETLHDCGSLTMDRNGYIYVCNERGNDICVF